MEKLLIAKIEKACAAIGQQLWWENHPIGDVALAETPERLTLAAAKTLAYRPVSGGAAWGEPWGSAWFRLRVVLPEIPPGTQLCLRFDPDGESLVFAEGEPWHGLDARRAWCVLPDSARRPGELLELYVESLAAGRMGLQEPWRPRVMQPPQLGIYVPEVWESWHDLQALAALIPQLPAEDTWRARLIRTLARVVDAWEPRPRSLEALRESCRHLRAALQPLLATPAHASAQTVAAIANAHIDIAWLWPLAETRRKSARTFANVLRLMERDPGFTFTQSQAYLYEVIRDHYPHLWEQVQTRYREGRLQIAGIMYIEADCNLPNGESLVRQMLVGRTFFRETFGESSPLMWLPDTFGYPACLPQLIDRSGLRTFFTQKMAWNNVTPFPYHSFWWEGLDGTRIISHVTPANSYNSELDAEHLLFSARHYREKDRCTIQAIPFGRGDGGGGPTPEMLARLRRFANLEGLPRLEPMSAEAFFERLEAESADLPTWRGELYLERHRGTFTSQSVLKRLHRRAEALLHDVEWLSARTGAAALAHDTWKLLLLNQFHDILPGCAIDAVYVQAEADLQQLLDQMHIRRGELLAQLPAAGGLVVANTLAHDRHEVVELPVNCPPCCSAIAEDGTRVPVQTGADGVSRFQASVPGGSHASYRLVADPLAEPALSATTEAMENDCLRLEFRDGDLVRIYDKRHDREILAPGAIGNRFVLFADRPVEYDAWEIEPWFSDTLLAEGGELELHEVSEVGPVRAVIRQVRRLSNSRIEQSIILTRGSSRIDFVTRIAWGDERDVLLKVAFPVAIRAEHARYETQFGSVLRPIHTNTPYDQARFEVPAQRWADLAEGDYGVALLNDCKYGYDIRGNLMRLSLLRAPGYPDPTADIQRTHQMTYSLLPHAGDFRHGVIEAAAELNQPLLAAPAGKATAKPLTLTIEGEHLFLETLKPAEDGRGIIARLYEAHGCRGRCLLRASRPLAGAIETNLMEDDEAPLPFDATGLSLTFAPWQIRTVRLLPTE